MRIKTGIIGISSGNGHPYSWSAIVNGYDEKEMDKCRFKVIPKYLKLYKNQPLNNVNVITHIWTQNYTESKKISKSSKIKNVPKTLNALVENVDCIIFARDDRTFLNKFSKILIKSKKPIFLDKPIATNLKELEKILASQAYKNQIFSTSFSRFCSETKLSKFDRLKIGSLKKIKCIGPKNSKKYLIHLVDPIVNNFCNNKKIISIKRKKNGKLSKTEVKWTDNLTTIFITTGKKDTNFQFIFSGSKDEISKSILNPYIGFKKSLIYFFDNMYKDVFYRQKDNLFKIVSILDESQ